MEQIKSLNNRPDKTRVMVSGSEKSKTVKDRSDRLAKLGGELKAIGFSYKIKGDTTEQYWQNKIADFKRYRELGLEYYGQAYAIIGTVDEKEAGMFLLQIGRFEQLGTSLLGLMEKIRENPSIMDSKDRQQSRWSRDVRDRIAECSDSSLKQERDMNQSFREFYDSRLRGIM